jgi:hypothetical protein
LPGCFDEIIDKQRNWPNRLLRRDARHPLSPERRKTCSPLPDANRFCEALGLDPNFDNWHSATGDAGCHAPLNKEGGGLRRRDAGVSRN